MSLPAHCEPPWLLPPRLLITADQAASWNWESNILSGKSKFWDQIDRQIKIFHYFCQIEISGIFYTDRTIHYRVRPNWIFWEPNTFIEAILDTLHNTTRMFVLLFKCYTRERWKDENIFLLVAGVRRCGERYRTDTELHMWPGGWRLSWCGLHTPAVWVRAWTKCTLHQLQKQYLVHALDREDKKEGLLQLVTEEFNEYLFQIQSRVMCVWYLWKYPYCCAIVSVQCAVVSTAFSADTVTRPPIAHTADTVRAWAGEVTPPGQQQRSSRDWQLHPSTKMTIWHLQR